MQRLSPAPKNAVQSAAKPLLAAKRFAALTERRLTTLIELMDAKGYINYAEAYAQLFPQAAQNAAAKTKADKAFKKFRDTLTTIADEHGVILQLMVDQHRNADAATRHFWFETLDDAESRLTEYNQNAIQGMTPHPQEQHLSVRNDDIATYLLVYAPSEQDDARDKLHKNLAQRFRAKGRQWRMLDFHDIPIGESPEQVQAARIQQADFILFCLSPALISDLKDARDFTRNRRLIPLQMKACKPKDLDNTALAGLHLHADNEGKTWNQRKGAKKDAWLDQATDAILNTLAQKITPNTNIFDCLSSKRQREDCLPEHFVEPTIKNQQDSTGQNALTFLLDWLNNPTGDVFCAIFGELGMGKTTLTQRLTQHLLEQRVQNPNLPLPVYLDLRYVNTLDWDWSQGAPSLEAMLNHTLENAYNLPAGSPRPGVEDIKRLAQQQRGLIIFDGLDEVMNHLGPQQCVLFIQHLWSVLPPAVWKSPMADGETTRPPGCGRLLMTCRSHFFQTLQDQINALSGQQREHVKAQDYLWTNLLPFTKQQVETYFLQVFQQDLAQAQRVITMLDEVHDLRDLSTRPYNLSLIQAQVEHLEAIRQRGDAISIADLYEGLVSQWTRRDDPKHRLKKEHKLLLMERLALRLWAGKSKQVEYQDLENWLLDELGHEPRWQLNYMPYLQQKNGIDILQEDLRNASFLVRDGECGFRFAHTSIMEFFLARALHRALLEGCPEHWATPAPSPETLDFLGGLIAGRETQTCVRALDQWRGEYRAQVSERVLGYALRAHKQDYPGARFDGFALPGAKLRGLRVQTQAKPRLNWRGANFSHADLTDSQFIGLDLTECCFQQADLTGCLFDDCVLDGVSAQEVDLTGTVLHACTANGADFSACRPYRSQWLTDQPPPLGLDAPPPTLFRAGDLPPPEDAVTTTTSGHSHLINAVAVDPQGRWIVSASDDHTLRIWDAASGQILRSLKGHTDWVTAVAVDPQGCWIVSGSDDHTLRLWDAASGQSLRTLEGHTSVVTAVAVDPQGRWIVSASGDNTLRLWDADSGQSLHTLEGHTSVVTAVAVHPQGRWIVSGSWDNTLRIWDADSGQSLRTLEGHTGWINAVAVHPQGHWIVSTSDDKTLLWEADSGQILRTVDDHPHSGDAVAVHPQGRWIVSASNKTLRLWDADSGQSLRTLADQSSAVNAVAVHPQGQWIVSGSNEPTLRMWDCNCEQNLRTLKGHTSFIRAVAVHPKGRWIVSGSWDRTLCIWDVDSGQSLRTLKGHTSWVNAVAVHPQGRWIVSGSKDETLRIWDADSGQSLRTLKGHTNPVTAVAVHPQGRWIVSGSKDKTLRIWDAASGQSLHTLEGHTSGVTAVAMHPQGRWIVSGARDQTLRIWDANSGQSLRTLKGHTDWVTAVAVHPQGRWIASGSNDQTLRLWDAGSGTCLAVLKGQFGPITAIAFDPQGRLISAAGTEILFWNIDTPTQAVAEHGIETLPEGNWVRWRDPLSPQRRVLQQSPDAWRWLRWDAPGPDGHGRMLYPIACFQGPG